MQPRQISPRKAEACSVRASEAATQGLIGRPKMFIPKNTRNSCIRSGVPWNSRMKAAATRLGAFASAVRASATIRPPTAPPMNAISERAMVQRIAMAISKKSSTPKGRIMAVLLSGRADR